MSITLDKRLAKIEHDRHSARGVAVVPKRADETKESAAARWMTEHPGDPDPRTAPMTVYITKWADCALPEGLTA
jgi:hypothetical protein